MNGTDSMAYRDTTTQLPLSAHVTRTKAHLDTHGLTRAEFDMFEGEEQVGPDKFTWWKNLCEQVTIYTNEPPL